MNFFIGGCADDHASSSTGVFDDSVFNRMHSRMGSLPAGNFGDFTGEMPRRLQADSNASSLRFD